MLKRQMEQTAQQTDELKAVTDYNIMMGNLDDPSEDEEGEVE